MSHSLSVKLLPLAFVFALGVFALLPGARAPTVLADVSEIDAPDTISSGTGVSITVSAQDDDGNLLIEVVGGDNPEITAVSAPAGCDGDVVGEGSDSISLDTADCDGDDNVDNINVSFTLTVDCDGGDVITVTATQGDDSEEAEIDCVVNNVIINKVATGATIDFDFTLAGDGSACDTTAALGHNESAAFSCGSGTFTVTESAESGWTLTNISCSDVGVPDSDIVVDLAGRKVTFTLGAGDSIECTFTNTSGTATATATTTPSQATQVTVSAAPTSVSCNGSSFITAVFKDAAGNPVANGTVVNISTNIGSVNPTQATTNGGSILVLFTAPGNSGGTATITASAGGISGQASVTVNCAQATATTAPPPPPTQAPPSGGGITPPRTGDAGLVDSNGVALYAGMALVVASILGALALVRSRA